MTRLRKSDPAELEREYIYSDPPLSITELADRHNLARSGVADKARIGKWYERREEFRRQLTEKSREALAAKWVDFETANREKLMSVAATYFDKYVEALNSGEIKVTTRDMLGMAAMMRTFLGDVAARPADDARLVGPDGDDFSGSPADARAIIEEAKRLMAGETK